VPKPIEIGVLFAAMNEALAEPGTPSVAAAG